MSFQLWRSLTATLSSLVFRFAVALSYAAGFNAMVFLPLYEARAQTPLPRWCRASLHTHNSMSCR
jgi:hypothetical protein